MGRSGRDQILIETGMNTCTLLEFQNIDLGGDRAENKKGKRCLGNWNEYERLSLVL